MLNKLNEIKAKFDEMTVGATVDEMNEIRSDINKEQLKKAVQSVVARDKKSCNLVALFDGVEYPTLDSEYNPTVTVVKPSQAIALKDSEKSVKCSLEHFGDFCTMIKKFGANIVLANSVEKGVSVAPEYTNFVPKMDFFNNENRTSRNSLEKQLQAILDYIFKDNAPQVKKMYVDAVQDLFVIRSKKNTDTKDKGEKDLLDCIQVVYWDIKAGKQYKHNSKLAQFKAPKDTPTAKK